MTSIKTRLTEHGFFRSFLHNNPRATDLLFLILNLIGLPLFIMSYFFSKGSQLLVKAQLPFLRIQYALLKINH